MNKRQLFLLFVVCFSVLALVPDRFIPEAQATATTTTIIATSLGSEQGSRSRSDSKVGNTIAYTWAHNNASGTSYTSGEVGQFESLSGADYTYTIYRSLLSFDTSSIPDNAIIAQMKLSIKAFALYQSSANFTIRIQKWTDAADGVANDDYSRFDGVSYDDNQTYTGSGTWTVGTWKNITFTSFSPLNRTGNTYLMLRTNRDISSNIPATNKSEYLVFYDASYSTEAYRPKLYVTYGGSLTFNVNAESTFGTDPSNVPFYMAFNYSTYGSINNVSATANFASTNPNGNYTLTFPTNVTSGGVIYTFYRWEDNSTNRVRSKIVTSSTTLTVYYKPYFNYTLRGIYNETTGYRIWNSNATVTAYYTDGTVTDIFELNGTYSYVSLNAPQYFSFDLKSGAHREFWVSGSDILQSIYVFDENLTRYTISFLDLAGALETYPYVIAKRYVNGTLYTMEKREIDTQKQVTMDLMNQRKYTISIASTTSYTYGELLMTDATSFQLTLKGIEFPSNIMLAYKYVRMYADRHNNLTSISMVYEDTLLATTSVNSTVYYQNGTLAYSNLQTGVNSFNVTWTSANYSLSYYVIMTTTHSQFGELTYRTALPQGYSSSPWGLAWLGTLPYNISTTLLVPVFIILCAMGVFSQKNAYVGMFAGITVTGLFVWIGWLPMASVTWSMIFTALLFTILYALGRKRRPEQ